MPTVVSTATESDFYDQLFGSTPAVTAPSSPVNPDQELNSDQIKDALFSAQSVLTEDEPEEKQPEPIAEKAPKRLPDAPVPSPVVDDEEYTKQVFKSVAANLIKKGAWVDIDGFDEMEIDQETFEELADMQDQHRMESRWDAAKQSSGMANALLTVLEAGGNPETLLDHYKQAKQLGEIDTTSEAGKLELIGQFYEKVVKLTPAQLATKLKKIEAGGAEDIASEFELANEKYQEHFAEQQEDIQAKELKRVAELEQRKKDRIMATAQTMRDNKLPTPTAQKLLRDMYAPKWDLQDGSEPISELDYRLLEIRNDPKKSVELARYILDPENYKKGIAQAEVNQKVEETFGKLKFTPKKSTGQQAPGTKPAAAAITVDKSYYQS